MKTARYRITPGSMGACQLAIDIFGIDRIDPGSWMTPVYVNDVREDEAGPARELLAEHSVKFEEAR